jgi:hypothetical protein
MALVPDCVLSNIGATLNDGVGIIFIRDCGARAHAKGFAGNMGQTTSLEFFARAAKAFVVPFRPEDRRDGATNLHFKLYDMNIR